MSDGHVVTTLDMDTKCIWYARANQLSSKKFSDRKNHQVYHNLCIITDHKTQKFNLCTNKTTTVAIDLFFLFISFFNGKTELSLQKFEPRQNDSQGPESTNKRKKKLRTTAQKEQTHNNYFWFEGRLPYHTSLTGFSQHI